MTMPPDEPMQPRDPMQPPAVPPTQPVPPPMPAPTPSGMSAQGIWNRVVRAAKLDPSVYRELAADQSATGQAFLVAAAAGLINGLTGEGGFFGRIISGAIGGVIGLVIWAGVILLVGRLFKGQAQYVGLLRGLGFASAPFAIGVIPVVGVIGAIWAIVASIRATREIHKVSDGSAIAIVLIPVAVLFLITLVAFAALFATLFGISQSVGS